MNRPPSAYDLPEDETGWQPGDPLNTKPAETSGYRFRALFDFRDEPDTGYSEECRGCPDASKWPDPFSKDTHKGVDALEELIRLTHRDRRRAELNGDDAA